MGQRRLFRNVPERRAARVSLRQLGAVRRDQRLDPACPQDHANVSHGTQQRPAPSKAAEVIPAIGRKGNPKAPQGRALAPSRCRTAAESPIAPGDPAAASARPIDELDQVYRARLQPLVITGEAYGGGALPLPLPTPAHAPTLMRATEARMTSAILFIVGDPREAFLARRNLDRGSDLM